MVISFLVYIVLLSGKQAFIVLIWQIGEIFDVGPFESPYVPESQGSWHPELIWAWYGSIFHCFGAGTYFFEHCIWYNSRSTVHLSCFLHYFTELGFCDFTARSTDSTKEWYFTSPNFDPSDPVNYAEYPLDTTCTYTLIAKHDQLVDVKFTYFNIDGIVPQWVCYITHLMYSAQI